jgi:hypothetical protein
VYAAAPFGKEFTDVGVGFGGRCEFDVNVAHPEKGNGYFLLVHGFGAQKFQAQDVPVPFDFFVQVMDGDGDVVYFFYHGFSFLFDVFFDVDGNGLAGDFYFIGGG